MQIAAATASGNKGLSREPPPPLATSVVAGLLLQALVTELNGSSYYRITVNEVLPQRGRFTCCFINRMLWNGTVFKQTKQGHEVHIVARAALSVH